MPEGDADIGVMKKPRLVSEVNRRVKERVGDAVQRGWLPVTLGGDHSLVNLDKGVNGICERVVADFDRAWELSPAPSLFILMLP